MAGPLLVFDAPSLLYRAFHALPDSIRAPDGPAVNALLGSVNLVLQEVERHAPRAVVACFGPDAAPYRVALYPPYHADRPPMPEGLRPQWELAGGFYAAFGWSVARDEELEADDLLGSYAAAEAEAGGRALVLTGDRDMFQCAGERVSVLYVRTGRAGAAEEVDAAEVRRRSRVPPELVPDFIALRGDPSDGLPGARGVGEKTAASLLHRHGSLEGAIAAGGRRGGPESPRVAEALRTQADELRAFKEIATLRRVDVALPADAPLDPVGAAAAARGLGMNRLAERLEGGGDAAGRGATRPA